MLSHINRIVGSPTSNLSNSGQNSLDWDRCSQRILGQAREKGARGARVPQDLSAPRPRTENQTGTPGCAVNWGGGSRRGNRHGSPIASSARQQRRVARGTWWECDGNRDRRAAINLANAPCTRRRILTKRNDRCIARAHLARCSDRVVSSKRSSVGRCEWGTIAPRFQRVASVRDPTERSTRRIPHPLPRFGSPRAPRQRRGSAGRFSRRISPSPARAGSPAPRRSSVIRWRPG